MAKIDQMVNEFLAQKVVAVVGVSDRRPSGANLSYTKFKNLGYTVYAVNPRIQSYENDPCYPNLKSLPNPPQAVFILAKPEVTEAIVAECIDLGVKHVWMHCMMGTKPGASQGTTSVSPKAVEMCKANGIQVIPGACPNQFLNPDFAHNIMKGMWKLFGFMEA